MIVLDTNVPSETSKARRDENAMRWLAEHDARLWLPTIALAELRYGVEKLPPSRQRTDLEHWLTGLIQHFAGRLIAFDAKAAEAHGRLRARLRAMGKPMDAPDSYIAAIALANGAPVATRNTGHFTHSGVKLIDPWAG
ncbi:type II toxin-antitoxin system VapC family toxin [Enterovirga sp. GCM10030262]|uniref:type II toxin-antitoxin system VapC family toxin n=1 Tax=Enterovirga sp. GCM10030262 TaxID=3273391 RepID=UPI0036242CE8